MISERAFMFKSTDGTEGKTLFVRTNDHPHLEIRPPQPMNRRPRDVAAKRGLRLALDADQLSEAGSHARSYEMSGAVEPGDVMRWTREHRA